MAELERARAEASAQKETAVALWARVEGLQQRAGALEGEVRGAGERLAAATANADALAAARTAAEQDAAALRAADAERTVQVRRPVGRPPCLVVCV